MDFCYCQGNDARLKKNDISVESFPKSVNRFLEDFVEIKLVISEKKLILNLERIGQ